MAKKFIVFCLVVLYVFSASAIDFSRLNISWQYDPSAEIQVQDRVVQKGDSLSVFIRFRYSTSPDWKIEYLIQSNYGSEAHKKFSSFSLDTLNTTSDSFIVKLDFVKPEENLMVAKISRDGAFYYYDIRLKNGSVPYSPILLVDGDGLPVFETYLNSANFSWLGADDFYVTEYVEDSDPAHPPMGDMRPLAPSILPDSIFHFADSVTFTDNNLYVVRADSNAVTGVTILKAAPYYPEFKLLGELVASMHYILNDPERKGLRNSRNLKESFDSFWIKTYTSKFRARNAIRNYFNWIEQANKRFTDFKQGWKTDRGMIYVVYGAPDEVYRTENEEEWYYDEGPSFEYTVISTFFSPETYALRRSLELRQSWFEFIAAMRRGTNE